MPKPVKNKQPAIADQRNREDSLELRDRQMSRQIASSNNDAKAGRVRPVEALLGELARGFAQERPSPSNRVAVTLQLPKDLLSQIDIAAGSTKQRESFVIAAIQAYLSGIQAPRKATKAIAKSTSSFETGQFED